MNNNLKKVIAIALAVGTISAISPTSVGNLLITKAYATEDENNETTLDSLKLETSGGDNIKLYSDDDYKNDNKVDASDVSDDGKYFAKTSSSKISVSTSGPNSKYVRVFKGTSDSTKGKKTSSDIELSSGKNTLTVRVYSKEPDSSVKYEEDDNVKSEYKITVKYTGSDSSSDSSDDYDEIFLDSLTVTGGDADINLNFSKRTNTYNIDVKSSVDEVTIKAKPEDTDDKVKIDGTTVDDGDKYKKTVSLKDGKNEIAVKVQDSDEEDKRVYTLNITRAASSAVAAATSTSTATAQQSTATATTGTSTATAVADTTVKALNKWVQINGKWQYNDSTGNPIKNNWFNDKSLGKWYYLGADGFMQTGWIISGGQYYYLNSDGSMATNTTIGLYKVGSDGAWIR